MTKPDPLEAVTLKIKRADKHIRNADLAIRKFRQRNPNIVVKEFDPSSGNEILKLHVGELSDDAADAASCAIYNLRSALDALAWAVVSRNNPPANPKSVDFPIVRSLEIFESGATQGKIQQLGLDWVDFVREIKPYPGGNDLLWALHDANIEDKHRRIIEVVFRCKPRSIRMYMGTKVNIVAGRFFQPVENGMELAFYKVPLEKKHRPNIEFALDVAFRDIEIIKGEPLPSALRQFADKVSGIVETARPRLFP